MSALASPTAPAPEEPLHRLTIAGWLRFAGRTAAMVLLLVICVTLDSLGRLLGGGRGWPRRFMTGVVWLSGVRITVSGKRESGRELILANHVSWIDIPVIGSVTGCAFVAHDGLTAIPLLHWICRRNDTVFVARHDRTSVGGQIDQVRLALDDTGALALFPEGTTSDGTGLLPFKSSLLSAIEPVPQGVVVQPALLDYGTEAADLAWVGEEHGAVNFRRILSRRTPVCVTLCFLPVLRGPELANRKSMAAAAQTAIGDELTRRRAMPPPGSSPQRVTL